MGSFCSTIELHPLVLRYIGGAVAACRAGAQAGLLRLAERLMHFWCKFAFNLERESDSQVRIALRGGKRLSQNHVEVFERVRAVLDTEDVDELERDFPGNLVELVLLHELQEQIHIGGVE